jgi:hypothetical protein
MIFQNNILREYLKNVYFLTGTACGGKSTTAQVLSDKYGIEVYRIDEHHDEHRLLSNPIDQPAMNRQFRDADEFFGRSVDEYTAWLLGNSREQLGYILLDLIRLSQDKKIICDCIMTVEEAQQLTVHSRVAFLVRDPVNLAEQYANRPDHQGFKNWLESASDVEKAKAVCSETLGRINRKAIADIKDSGYFYLERKGDKTPEEVAQLVAQHFGW